METATRVEAAIVDGTPLDAKDIETLCRNSLCDSELYAQESLRMEMASYIKDVEARIYELECANFLPDEICSFKKICNVLAENLDTDVWAEYDGHCMDVPYLTTMAKAMTAHPNDHWAHRYEARLKTLVVGGGKVPFFKHEEWLFGSAPIKGIPTEIQIPESVFYDIANAREFVAERLGKGWQSLASIRKTMSACCDEAIKLDPSFCLDMYFVNECYGSLITDHLQQCMLTLLPSVGEVRALSKTVLAARTLTTGDVVMAMDEQLKRP